ncbi:MULTISPECIES: D-alanyl-D-alanine carboxypeptidase family protein [unclassified Mycobacterium]|uniref:D-alanyl-D-alanine carboxypeptidase family protein n=1 Tax=unclassified Mycobacterium TaxID=2642494 RepID=UPI0029C82CA6|nr:MULTISPECIES: D-alanyl-D-alanine carboxypeptidase family protein [unclassified Mycobacterium]
MQIGGNHVAQRWFAEVMLVAAATTTVVSCAPAATTQSFPGPSDSSTGSQGQVPVVASNVAPQALVIGGAATTPPTGAASETPDAMTIGSAGVDTWSGWLPDGKTFSPFDTVSQPITRLDPLLLRAVQDATRAAASQGVNIALTSGWRSKGFQQRLFADAVRQYGSVDVAQQFVASPEGSKHVLGEAVDVTGAGVSDWLIRNGAEFGLCQIYANENWHFELAVDENGRCPTLRANAAG